jgi:preprotein translocase subunit SecA
MVSRSIEKAQRRVEEHHFGVRRRLLEYDEVMNEQRKLVYSLRQKILEWQELRETMLGWIEDVAALAVEREAGGEEPPGADAVRRMVMWARRKFLVELPLPELEGRSSSELEERIIARVKEVYAEREKEFGEVTIPQPRLIHYTAEEMALAGEARTAMVKAKLAEALEVPPAQVPLDEQALAAGNLPTMVECPKQVRKMRLLERFIMLDMIDSKWKDHLHNMDVLREGIYLRSYAQKDPKIEYKREGFEIFVEMFSSMKEQASDIILKAQPTADVEQQKVESVWNEDQAQTIKEEAKSAFAAAPEGGTTGGSAEMQAHSEHGGEQVKAVATIRRTGRKVLPNDPCPCGSGKKYKKCCGRYGGGASRGRADHKGKIEIGG